MCNSRRRRGSSSRTWIDTVRGFHVLRRSMSLIILFSCFTSIARFFLALLAKTGMAMLVSGREMRDGSADAGLAHVCQTWRNIILGRTSYLGVSLTVSVHLARASQTCWCVYQNFISPSTRHRVINYFKGNHAMTAEDEEGVTLAFKQRSRICRVRLRIPVASQEKLVVAMNEECPILEYLIITIPTEDTSIMLIFSGTLQAPHPCHLSLKVFAFPIGSRILTNATGLGPTHPRTSIPRIMSSKTIIRVGTRRQQCSTLRGIFSTSRLRPSALLRMVMTFMSVSASIFCHLFYDADFFFV